MRNAIAAEILRQPPLYQGRAEKWWSTLLYRTNSKSFFAREATGGIHFIQRATERMTCNLHRGIVIHPFACALASIGVPCTPTLRRMGSTCMTVGNGPFHGFSIIGLTLSNTVLISHMRLFFNRLKGGGLCSRN
jgi:hypothetical protein